MDNRYEGLHRSYVLDKDETSKLIELLNCDLFQNLQILRQIGSDSVFGTVWLAILEKDPFYATFAIKIQTNRRKAHQEFNIQYKLSSIFPNNFLIPYTNIDCDQITFNDDNQQITKKSGNFIFMEVAIGDLFQVLKYNYISDKELIEYVLQIIDSVEIMSLHSIYHGDLHIRQVFIVQRNHEQRNNKYRAVIGDFGESIEFVSATTHLSDIGYFLTSLNESLDNVNRKHSLFDDKLDQSIKYIDRSKRINTVSDETSEIKIKELIINDLNGLKKIFL